MRKHLTFFFFLFNIGSLLSQANPDNFAKMVDFVPPPPNASSIIKSSILSTNKNTGSPNINIPLGSIDGKFLKMPILLSYSSTGIKVDEISGRVGMGWALKAGGVITRTLRAKPDEISERINPPSPFGPNCESYKFMKDAFLENGAKDSEPDLFNISVNDIQLSFVFDAQMNPVLLTPDKIIIQTDFTINASWNFKVIDKNGITYFFGGVNGTEKSKRTQYCGKSYNILRPSAWYLIKVEHPNGEQILLDYTSINYTYETGSSQTIIKTSQYCGQNSFNDCVNGMYTEGKILSTITGKYNKAVFSYIGRSDVSGDKLNSEIKIFDLSNLSSPIYSYNFNYTIVSGNNTYNHFAALGQNVTPYLTSLTKKSGNLINQNSYNFYYNSPSTRPPRLAFAQDHWGYFNGKYNSNLLPIQTLPELISMFPNAQADRSVSENNASKGLLTKIEYPTGGTDEISYESNQYFNGTSNEFVGGVRVKKIISKTSVNDENPQIKNFYYGQYSDLFKSSLHSAYKPDYVRNYYKKIDDQNFCEQTALHSNSLVSLNNFQNSVISYEYVTEGIGENFEGGAIQTRFHSKPDARGIAFHGEEILGTALSNFSSAFNGKVREEIIYKKGLSNLYIVQKSENLFFLDTRINIQDMYGYAVNQKYGNNAEPDCSNMSNGVSLDLFESFDVTKYGIYSDWVYLKETIQTNYSEDGTVLLETNTKFDYESLDHLQLTKIETTDSESSKSYKKYKYPHDYLTNPTYSNMVNANILSPIINYKETKTNQEIPIREVQTDYNFTNNNFVPHQIKQSIGGSIPLEVEGTFTKYDVYGNVLEYVGKDGVTNAIIWGYNYRYPVAKITGSSYDLALSKLDVSLTTLQNFEGNTLINELNKIRINLPEAFVTTYTYINSVGVKSISDQNSKSNYFEYDDFNRLVLVRDNDNNILKKYCYTYTGEQEDCTSSCTNTTPNWSYTNAPLRCEVVSCVNTGYQEKEQMDINPCSPTYNQTRWVQADYNPTACSTSSMVFITSNNLAAYAGYVANFTNNLTQIETTFEIPVGAGSIQIGCLPTGIYKVDIYKPSGMGGIMMFTIGSNIQTGPSATFYNINLAIIGNRNIKMDWDL